MNATRPLARVLLRKVVAAYLVFALALTGIELYVEYRNIRQNIAESLDRLAMAFAPSAAQALWDYQQDLLQALAAGISEHNFVVAVNIRDINGRMNVDFRTPAGGSSSSSLTARQPLSHRFQDGQQETLGVLSITSSEALLFSHLKERALSVGLAVIAQLLFLGGVLALLSQMLVVKPLTRFSQQVGQLIVEEGRAKLIDFGGVEITEIAILQQGFNRLLQQVAENHALMAAANADLEQRVAERTHDLDRRNQELSREHELILALVRASPGFVCILDEAGRILVANASAEALIGHPAIRLSEQSWPILPILAAADHPLRQLLDQVRRADAASVKASFSNQRGQERRYQFEALRIGRDAEVRIIVLGMDITEEHEQKLRLQHQAFYDRLTGLPNRALLLNRLEQTITAAHRRKTSFAVAFVDLDQFKPINDSAGHEAGDAVLREIAARLRQCVRESDIVARYGGDEFVLLLLDSTDQGLQRVASAILEAAAQPILWQETQFKISASVGFAMFPSDGDSAKALLDVADAAMYRAKQAGRNRVDFGCRGTTDISENHSVRAI